MKKKDLMNESYDISKYIVMNESKTKQYAGSDSVYRDHTFDVYDIEKQLTDEEKLQVIDSRTNGLGTYILNLIKKYNEARVDGTIRKVSYGSLHKRSLQSWIDKNDPRKVMCAVITKGYGQYRLFRQQYRMTLDTPETEFGYKLPYDSEPVVRNWFHNMLIEIENEEVSHYKAHNDVEILKTSIRKRLEAFNGVRWVHIDVDTLSKEKLELIEYMLSNCESIVNSSLEHVENIANDKEVI